MEQLIRSVLSQEAANDVPKVFNKVLAQLINSEKIRTLSNQLNEMVKEAYTMNYEIETFQEAHLPISNANAKKDYSFTFNLQDFPRIRLTRISDLELFGLSFNPETNTISGKPLVAATTQLELFFYCESDPAKTERKKLIPFIINADPKDLWQNISFPKDSLYYKPDEAALADTFLDKKIVVASKRGRSHAHQGTSRDDDFQLSHLPDGWDIIALADGAGSAQYARKGAEEATHFIASILNDESFLLNLSQEVINFYTQADSFPHKKVIIKELYAKVLALKDHLSAVAEKEQITLKDLHTTLIFALAKHFSFGYVLLTFGVGDCPICVLAEDETEVHQLNLLDIGEYSGGTRFITMPEIFSNTAEIPFAQRFAIHRFDSFSKLFLMTDGIYDPKFGVENNLLKIEAWHTFLKDLAGENDDACRVDFQDDTQIAQQLLSWLDFWSKGNSDDRTLAIIY